MNKHCTHCVSTWKALEKKCGKEFKVDWSICKSFLLMIGRLQNILSKFQIVFVQIVVHMESLGKERWEGSGRIGGFAKAFSLRLAGRGFLSNPPGLVSSRPTHRYHHTHNQVGQYFDFDSEKDKDKDKDGAIHTPEWVGQYSDFGGQLMLHVTWMTISVRSYKLSRFITSQKPLVGTR